VLALGVCLLLTGAVIVAVYLGRDDAAQPPAAPKDAPPPGPPVARGEPPPELPEGSVYIGRTDAKRRRIHTILTTRKGDTPYQALIRYQPRAAPSSELPGLVEILQALAARNQQLPNEVVRIDQETEALIDNLGEVLHSITSVHFYLNRATGQVIAYDVATTTGGQPQRFIGHVTRSGVTVEVFRGGDYVDRHDIPLAGRDTFIPVEMEFIHQWFQNRKEEEPGKKTDSVKFSIFAPETMSHVLLVAAPMGDQVVPIKDRNYECVRYDVRAVSTQAAEGLQARQEMWFDKRTGLLMKREDFDPALTAGDRPVTERGGLEHLAQLRQLVSRPPELPAKPFPYRLGAEQTYRVRVGGKDMGSVRLRFSAPDAATDGDEAAYMATAAVNLEPGEAGPSNALRRESAVTRFDRNWRPVSYTASGEEIADAKAAYKIESKVGGGEVRTSIQREVSDLPDGAGSAADATAPKETPFKDPLKRVPVSDEEARAAESAVAAPRFTSQQLKRPLSPGTYLYDFNRLEQLAAIAYRLSLPASAPEKTEVSATYQKVALYLVRQHRAGVILFEVKPEPRPVLTERQRKRLPAAERDEPPLFVATVQSAMLPCRMLLSPDGRLLEVALKYGSSEAVYTLDDPIMQRRAERAKKQKLQEGPQLIRPPWW
jgi:hypothetical protein